MARGGSRKVAKFSQENILIAFDFIWKVLLSDRNFTTLLDPPLDTSQAVAFYNSIFQYFFQFNKKKKLPRKNTIISENLILI